MSSLLRCTVKNCGRPLVIADRVARCEAGHSFDRARSGYWNLLQPQDRKAREPGDAVAAARARRALFAAGHDDAVVSWIATRTPRGSQLLDVGCGEGSLVERLSESAGAPPPVGIDLSARALELAARSYPTGLWVVANADRGLPLLDQSIDLAISITGRRPGAELHRVLRKGGRLIVGVPAPDDLRELRQLVQGPAEDVSRVERILGELSPTFERVEQQRWSQRVSLETTDLENLLVASYRAARGRLARLGSIDRLEVTIARDLLLLEPR